MRERRRKHDDAHIPLGGKGKRATKPKSKPSLVDVPLCADCGKRPKGMPHLCDGSLTWAKQQKPTTYEG